MSARLLLPDGPLSGSFSAVVGCGDVLPTTSSAASLPTTTTTAHQGTTSTDGPSTLPSATSSANPTTSAHPTTSTRPTHSTREPETTTNVLPSTLSLTTSTPLPISAPTVSPTRSPTATPTSSPTRIPTATPTPSPTRSPTATPTSSPTRSPTATPTSSPTRSPTATLTIPPISFPSSSPTAKISTAATATTISTFITTLPNVQLGATDPTPVSSSSGGGGGGSALIIVAVALLSLILLVVLAGVLLRRRKRRQGDVAQDVREASPLPAINDTTEEWWNNEGTAPIYELPGSNEPYYSTANSKGVPTNSPVYASACAKSERLPVYDLAETSEVYAPLQLGVPAMDVNTDSEGYIEVDSKEESSVCQFVDEEKEEEDHNLFGTEGVYDSRTTKM